VQFNPALSPINPYYVKWGYGEGADNQGLLAGVPFYVECGRKYHGLVPLGGVKRWDFRWIATTLTILSQQIVPWIHPSQARGRVVLTCNEKSEQLVRSLFL